MPNNPKLHFPLSVLLHDGNLVLTVAESDAAVAGGDFVTRENTGLNWFFYNLAPDIAGPSATPQYEGGPNLTDPYMPQPPNLTAGTVS